jgi:hypothetical protein
VHNQVKLVNAAIDKICRFMEDNDDCQLKDEVSGHIPDNKTIRARLMQKYGNNSYFVENSLFFDCFFQFLIRSFHGSLALAMARFSVDDF